MDKGLYKHSFAVFVGAHQSLAYCSPGELITRTQKRLGAGALLISCEWPRIQEGALSSLIGLYYQVKQTQYCAQVPWSWPRALDGQVFAVALSTDCGWGGIHLTTHKNDAWRRGRPDNKLTKSQSRSQYAWYIESHYLRLELGISGPVERYNTSAWLGKLFLCNCWAVVFSPHIPSALSILYLHERASGKV